MDLAYVISCQDYFMSRHNDIRYIVAAYIPTVYHIHFHKITWTVRLNSSLEPSKNFLGDPTYELFMESVSQTYTLPYKLSSKRNSCGFPWILLGWIWICKMSVNFSTRESLYWSIYFALAWQAHEWRMRSQKHLLLVSKTLCKDIKLSRSTMNWSA